MLECQPARFATTLVGSVPHCDPGPISRRIASCLDIPVWPQLPRRSFRESMYVQYSAGLPGLIVDEENEKVYFDTSGDLTAAFEDFYSRVLADDLDSFALPADHALGFHALFDALKDIPSQWIKGQIIGPISFGLTVTDHNLRASLYDEMLADVIVKQIAMSARWQARELRRARPCAMLFVDEPYLASFGSAFISLSREQAVGVLNEVFAAIQSEGALAGVHCCANTDWSLLLETRVDILNLDAWGYLENFALYPAQLRAFLDRGGVVAWGIVPNDEDVLTVTPQQIAERLRDGIRLISTKAQARGVTINPADFGRWSLLTPRCGLRSVTPETADRAIDVLAETSAVLRRDQ